MLRMWCGWSLLTANKKRASERVNSLPIPSLWVCCAQGLLGSAGGAKGTTAANALEALTEDNSVLLVDIRSSAAAKEQGSPAPGRTAGKSISLPYTKVRRGSRG